jgi:CRP-like cAMP-binding protein
MTDKQLSHRKNRLLAELTPVDFTLLAPHLREVLLFPGDLLHRPGEQIKQVYFLQSGIVSLMAILEGGKTVETVSVGHEGAIGTIEGFGSLHMTVMAHVQQTTACNAVHDLTSRLSRILLLSADRCDDHIQLSHESLAEMLGVRRSSVTTAATTLRESGAIQYRRASIRILDRQKLEKIVCECYPTIRRTIDAGFWKTHGR